MVGDFIGKHNIIIDRLSKAIKIGSNVIDTAHENTTVLIIPGKGKSGQSCSPTKS
jgi:hypothetical protein